MGICGCKGARLRAGNEWVDFEEGKCFIFDDSFIHEVRHSGSELRQEHGRNILIQLDVSIQLHLTFPICLELL